MIVATESEMVFEIKDDEKVFKIKRAQIVPIGIEQIDP